MMRPPVPVGYSWGVSWHARDRDDRMAHLVKERGARVACTGAKGVLSVQGFRQCLACVAWAGRQQFTCSGDDNARQGTTGQARLGT